MMFSEIAKAAKAFKKAKKAHDKAFLASMAAHCRRMSFHCLNCHGSPDSGACCDGRVYAKAQENKDLFDVAKGAEDEANDACKAALHAVTKATDDLARIMVRWRYRNLPPLAAE